MVNINDYEERFGKFLSRSHDTTLLVLKGHLLMEELNRAGFARACRSVGRSGSFHGDRG